ncbi:cellulose synthase catalytic subunit (UDP-forming) [Alteromonas sp. BL110]|uniref:UDP-forming cellulose synthase catalytic subunit n=2 Tax=Alteromonas sp. BL110 TaxID=1714845 RepID=UPI000E4F4475|nr:UDP-forming cellulose synthase catalytic subunit [Alteromonas sp. BL110]AXT39124.1 cellulose synthase catalytic subunit (UDP-forming) [Alteromonas sp. BL110]RKM85221.1 cellulose synthase catalytic subunit (UDP-forming) [Alteromonas sp. BL110]
MDYSQTHRHHYTSKLILLLLVASCLLGGLLLAPMDALGQLLASITILIFISLCSKEARHTQKYQHLFRIFALVLAIALSVRYLLWRGIYTLTYSDILSMIAVWLLFAAEIYAGITSVLGAIVNAFPLSRPLLSLDGMDKATLPSVDVMIPSYNEDEEILEVTIRAAKMLDYPKDKLHIHLLDDGGTDQKINADNPISAASARQRRQDLQSLCSRLGITYHTRAKNEFAKAGNVNSAIQNTTGDLIVILDADHVPTSDFLDRTVPWMLKNEKVFLVQTPHFMANPDPVERNYFSAFTRMPSENDMFYGTIQKGLDYWGSSFFCGSAALMRRKHLDLVGGISGDSITEDAETALDLHKMGYESVYVDRPMVSGLAPETFDAFIQQRMRWAQGMTQILLLKKPFKAEGLKWYQRVGYMSSIMFWLFPFARIIFLLMPLAYLVFGLQVYHASILEIFAFTLPHVVATYMISTMLFGRTRWPLVSELYEILQCAFTLNALVKVFLKPRAPSFVVTPKGESLEKTFVSPLSSVFYWGILLITFALGCGVYKLITEPLTRELTVVVLLWNVFNLILLLSVLSVLLERKQVRSQARLPATNSVVIKTKSDEAWVGDLVDLSLGGARLRLKGKGAFVPEKATLSSWSHALNKNVHIAIVVLNYDSKSKILRVRFVPETEEQENEAIAFALCDSLRWLSFQRRRTRPISYWFGAKHVLKVGLKPALLHMLVLIGKFADKLGVLPKSVKDKQ